MNLNALIEKFLTGWSNDLPNLLTIFTDNIVYTDKQIQAELHDNEELKKFAQAFFAAFPDILFTLFSSPIQTDTRAAFVWRVTGTHRGQLLDKPASNKMIDFTGVSLMEFSDGKIARTTDYWDLATLLRQIGH
jgi:steroid delta-isomerase-like uncharacterized protein